VNRVGGAILSFDLVNSVSLDLLIRLLLSAGAITQDIAEAIQDKAMQ
jgi:hypothetical protein